MFTILHGAPLLGEAFLQAVCSARGPSMVAGSWGGRQCPRCKLQPNPGLSLPDPPAWAPALGPSTFDHLEASLNAGSSHASFSLHPYSAYLSQITARRWVPLCLRLKIN